MKCIYGLTKVPDQSILVTLGTTLIILGFAIAFIAILLMFIQSLSFRGKVRGGGLVMIGPVPIIFGTDRESMKILIALAILLIIIVVVLMLTPKIII